MLAKLDCLSPSAVIKHKHQTPLGGLVFIGILAALLVVFGIKLPEMLNEPYKWDKVTYEHALLGLDSFVKPHEFVMEGITLQRYD
jgi:hypothetical protein